MIETVLIEFREDEATKHGYDYSLEVNRSIPGNKIGRITDELSFYGMRLDGVHSTLGRSQLLIGREDPYNLYYASEHIIDAIHIALDDPENEEGDGLRGFKFWLKPAEIDVIEDMYANYHSAIEEAKKKSTSKRMFGLWTVTRAQVLKTRFRIDVACHFIAQLLDRVNVLIQKVVGIYKPL